MTYKEMLTALQCGYPCNLARRKDWPEDDKVAYVMVTYSLEKRENGIWVPYNPDEADGCATDWEIASLYS